MAGNDVALFDPKANMPAHIANFFGSEGGSNIDNRSAVPSLSPEGKMWTISLNGTKTKLEKRNADGDVEPVNIMRVVIVDYAKRRGRAYYEGAYDPANVGSPVCWSDDGIKPDDTVVKKQHPTCEGCPMSIKGSKVSDNGKAITACSQHRMLAVVPAHKLDFEPLRLKIAITSDWDKQSPEMAAQGWHGFQNYTDFLKSRGVQHTAALVTKMKFDPNAAYPKIFFAADRWLEPAEIAQVAPLTKDDAVKQLLGGTFTPAGPDGVRKDATTDSIEQPQTKAQVATAATAVAEVAPQPAADDPVAMAKAALAAAEAAAAANAPKSVTGTIVEDDDDGGEIIMAGIDAPAATLDQGPAQANVAAPEQAKTTANVKAAAAPAVDAVQGTATVDPALGALLADWGGD